MKASFLVIGASGYLGQQVVALLPDEVVATHCHRPKLLNSRRYDFYEDSRLPIDLPPATTVIFTAAVEMNRQPAQLVAAMKRLLSQVAERRFVYISSDAVYNGKQGNYVEQDAPDPVNAYGRNLVECEALIAQSCTDFCIIRPSYIYGFCRGQLDLRLLRTKEALSKGDTVALYDDYFKSPLSVQEVATAVAWLASVPYQGVIHVAGERMSAYHFHQRAMTALGVDTTRLQAQPMPDQPGLMRDTSLDSSRWWEMCRAKPLSIAEGLDSG